jgi:hypothetical protein
MKTYGGMKEKLHFFITWALYGREWSASRPVRFNPVERAPGIHPSGGWVSPRAGLDAEAKREITCPERESKPGCPVTIVTILTELPGSYYSKVGSVKCTVYHLNRNPKTITYYGTKMKTEAGPPPCNRLSQSPPSHSSQGHPGC